MNLSQSWLSRLGAREIGGLLGICLVLLLVSKALASAGYTNTASILQIVVFTLIAGVVLLQPVWGIVIIVGAIPIQKLLPNIPFSTSLFPVFGAVTLASYVAHEIIIGRRKPTLLGVHIVSGLFVMWAIVSHPFEAMQLGARVWTFTLVQLWLFTFLVTQLVRSVDDSKHVMIGFILTVLVSALLAISQAHVNLTSETSIRAIGYVGSPNILGRLFVVGVIFLIYLRIEKLPNALTLAGLALLLIGLALTVSRTSLLLLFFSVLMMLAYQAVRREHGRMYLLLVAIAVAAVAIPLEYWSIVSGIPSSIVRGTDSVGFRYQQWQATFAMWLENPIAGVGIGQAKAEGVFYGRTFLPYYGLNMAPHNAYLSILVETGLVGFILFVSMLGMAIASLVRSSFRKLNDASFTMYTWLVVLLTLLVGGMTTSDQFNNKLIWFCIGLTALSSLDQDVKGT